MAQAATQPTVLLSCQNLGFAFGARTILSEISFELQSEKRLCILGPNGSGKTTLLRILSGELVANSGTLRAPGKSETAVIPQKLHLVPQLSALSNTIHGSLGRTNSKPWYAMQGLAPNSLRREALIILKSLDLTAHAIKPVSALSGGLAQRVAVARALMQKPKLLLADEPTSALDPVAANATLTALSHTARQHNCALIFTLHQPGAALANSDLALLLRDGRIIHFGPSSSVTAELLARAYD